MLAKDADNMEGKDTIHVIEIYVVQKSIDGKACALVANDTILVCVEIKCAFSAVIEHNRGGSSTSNELGLFA
jgi:hypothetical protein